MTAPANGQEAALARAPVSDALMARIEKVLVQGDLSALSEAERVHYYNRTCDSLGLNPLTRPFDYIKLNSKLVLYAKRDATDQLRASRRVSIAIVAREQIGETYVVTARATTPDGRCDESTGAVCVTKLSGEALSNALMKAETKAKRRVTLSIVGLGWLDESEIASTGGTPVPMPDTSPPAGVAVSAEDDLAHDALERAFLDRIRDATNVETDLMAVYHDLLDARLGQERHKRLSKKLSARRKELDPTAGKS